MDSAVDVHLATGTWNGLTFNHTLPSIEDIRGSRDYGDKLKGDGNDNNIRGMGGNDTVIGGGTGKDVLKGGGDWLNGGSGNGYVMTGGKGQDTFVFFDGDGKDNVKDFTDDVDILEFDSSLWGGGAMTAADLVTTYASLNGAGDVVFNFGGGDKLTLTGFSDLAALADDISIV